MVPRSNNADQSPDRANTPAMPGADALYPLRPAHSSLADHCSCTYQILHDGRISDSVGLDFIPHTVVKGPRQLSASSPTNTSCLFPRPRRGRCSTRRGNSEQARYDVDTLAGPLIEEDVVSQATTPISSGRERNEGDVKREASLTLRTVRFGDEERRGHARLQDATPTL